MLLNISSTISIIQRIIVQDYSKEKIMEIPRKKLWIFQGEDHGRFQGEDHGDLDNISYPRFVRYE